MPRAQLNGMGRMHVKGALAAAKRPSIGSLRKHAIDSSEKVI